MCEDRGTRVLLAMLVAGALALGGGVSLAATGEKAPEASKTPAISTVPATPGSQEGKEMKSVRGHVTAVDPTAKTLSIKPMQGKEAETIGVEVPDTAKITQGKATKTLADIKVGERVWMKYDRTGDKLEADQIHILRSGKTANQSASKNKTS